MATMSIIPSDSTIMMTVGDDDSAVKDILPIVLRAYQSSSIGSGQNFIDNDFSFLRLTIDPH